MKTPKRYTDNLKQGLLTEEMIKDCLYSVNKRAKNCRDQERKYRHCSDYYNNEEKYYEKKQEYYKQKSCLLSLLQPVCIHREFFGYEKIRVYDYEPEYYIHQKKFVWENSFWNKEEGCETYFGDYYDENRPQYKYYLFYELMDRGFHEPIEKEDLKKYLSLKEVKIDRLVTCGADTNDLLSAQFVKKVIDLIECGEYDFV